MLPYYSVFDWLQADVKPDGTVTLSGEVTRPTIKDDAVNRLKGGQGKDIVVYGGATFVSSLIENKLIDELNLFVNPVAIGTGMQIFKSRQPLKRNASTAYASGIVVNTYAPG